MYRVFNKLTWDRYARIQRGDMGSGPPPPPLKNYKNIGFLSNTGPDPLKNHKATFILNI